MAWLASLTRSFAGFVVVVLGLAVSNSAPSQARCIEHSDCSPSEYCTLDGFCLACRECALRADACGGACPNCRLTRTNECTYHEHCTIGVQYCDASGGCFACEGCLVLQDGISNTCPQWCTSATPTSFIAQNGSKMESSSSSSKARLSNAELTVVVVVVVVVVLSVIGAICFIRYSKRKEERHFAQMASALMARERASQTLLMLSSRSSQYTSQASLQNLHTQRNGPECIKLDGSQALQMSDSSKVVQTFCDDEFLDFANGDITSAA